MMKKVALGILVVVLVVAGGAYYLLSNLDSLVKAAVETYGSEATQTRVSLGKVELKISDGQASLGDLKVMNPKGFSDSEAMSLGLISVKLDVANSNQTLIVIKEVVIERPHISYEQAAAGGNLETIQKNAQAYGQKMAGGGAGGGGSSASSSASKTGKPEPKLVIENLYVRDGRIGISHAALQGRKLESSLPTIHLTDIGKAKGGATPAEVAERVLGSISQSASRVAVSDLQKQLGDQFKGAAGALQQNSGGAADRLKGLLSK
ncbi:hypothetical protein [Ferrovibrio sp.]|uniref:hypothetical protein n=1 Tax=Ferrovibrio sp. TaxID=1917215 RepID=UPI0025C73B74|nr:hypothetical protein [Ferrovibrio sp.]MBX3453797.1 hypothetical protein [Ferrovibrio sp.]